MKKSIYVALAATAAHGEIIKPNKKLSGKHPLNKLARLQKFGFDFAEFHMNDSEAQVSRVKTAIESITTNMANSWKRPNCGYFDETTSKGGPDPNPDTRSNGKPRSSRMRREANQWMFDACECELDGHQNCYDDMSKNQHAFYIDSVLNEMFCDDDEVESGECSYLDSMTCTWVGDTSQAVRGSGSSGSRLSEVPEKAVKQITGGLKKWALRYINNCSGMRNGKKPVKRVNNLYKKWIEKVSDE